MSSTSAYAIEASEYLAQAVCNDEDLAQVDFGARMALPLHASSEPINIGEATAHNAVALNVMMPGSPPATSCITDNVTASAVDSGDVESNSLITNTLSLTLMQQSSPPPHSYRHSRAYRHFKNPPQPHMCIRTTTDAGEELFINVLSWTRIVIPQEPSDPIPLYGGMRVPPGSPRSPPIVFAVMANPEVLKDSGRHSKDPEERRAMVELMCDFVEAMNPGVKLVRNAVILRDRDISGELKDVWNAVQAQRDREREEQLLQQRQQQHYHNITTQQMFPKSEEGAPRNALQTTENEATATKAFLNKESPSGTITATDNITATEQHNLADHKTANNNANHNQQESTLNVLNGNEKSMIEVSQSKDSNSSMLLQQKRDSESSDQIDATNKMKSKDEIVATTTHGKTNAKTTITNASHSSLVDNPAQTANHKTAPPPTLTSPTSPTNSTTATAVAITAASTQSTSTATTATSAAAATAIATVSVATAAPPPSKKDKLGGFLPNGCIFPRFKNNKHKDKDKDKEKEKEPKSKDKEKTLLNALKKSKDKKVAPIEHHEKTTADSDASAAAKSQYEKNCINLENEVQKLDLNKIDTNPSGDNMFIKLKVAATSAVTK